MKEPAVDFDSYFAKKSEPDVDFDSFFKGKGEPDIDFDSYFNPPEVPTSRRDFLPSVPPAQPTAQVEDVGDAPLLRRPVRPAAQLEPFNLPIMRRPKPAPAVTPSLRPVVTSRVSEDVDLSDLSPMGEIASSGSTAVVPLSVQIKPEEVGKVDASVLMRRALFDYAVANSISPDYAKEWIDREQLAGNLPTYDMRRGRGAAVRSFDELSRTGAFNPETNTARLNFDKSLLEKFRGDWDANKGYVRTIKDDAKKVYEGKAQPGQVFYDVVAPPAAAVARGVELAARPLQAAATLGNAGLRTQMEAAKLGDPLKVIKGTLGAVLDTLTTGETPKGYETPLREITNRLPGAAADVAGVAADIVGDPANLLMVGAPIVGLRRLRQLGKLGKAADVAPRLVRRRAALVGQVSRPAKASVAEAQVKEVVRGTYDAALLDLRGSAMPKIPADLKTVATDRGVYVYNPKLTSREELLSGVKSGRFVEPPLSRPRASVSPAPSAPPAGPSYDTRTAQRLWSDTLKEEGGDPRALGRSRDPALKTAAGWYKAALLGPKTHMRNVASTASFQLFEEASRLPAAIADMAISKVTGVRSVTGPNVGALLRSSKEAATKGVREAAGILRTGATPNQLRIVDEARELASGSRVIDAFVNGTFRLLAAEDQVFRVYALRRSLEDRARVLALNELKKGTIERKAVNARIAELVKNPSEEMAAGALADSEVATFNNANVLHDVYMAARRGMGQMPAGRAVNFGLDVLFPFTRTPLNIVSRAFDYTPIGAAKASVRAALQRGLRGTFTEAEQRAFAQTFGRSVTGSTVITLGYMMAERGMLTGANESYQDYARSLTTGRQEMSVKAGNQWVRIGGFSPVGNLLVTGATIYEQSKLEGGNAMLTAAGDIMMEQPFASTTKDIVKAVTDPGRNAAKVAGRIAGGFVPTVLSDIAQGTDEFVRDRGQGFTGQIAGRVPGWRNTLPARRDMLNEPVRQDRMNAINPASTMEDRTADPVRAEIARLGVDIAPRRGQSEEESKRYASALSLVLGDSTYRGLPDEEKQAVFRNVKGYVRDTMDEPADVALYNVRVQTEVWRLRAKVATQVRDPAKLKEVERKIRNYYRYAFIQDGGVDSRRREDIEEVFNRRRASADEWLNETMKR